MKNIVKTAFFLGISFVFYSSLQAVPESSALKQMDIQQIQQAIAQGSNTSAEQELTPESDRSIILSAIIICSVIAQFKKLKKLLNQYIKTISSEELKQVLKATIEANKPDSATVIFEHAVAKNLRSPHLYELFEVAVAGKHGEVLSMILQQPQAKEFSLVDLSKGLFDAAAAQQHDMVHVIAAFLVTRTAGNG